MSSVVKSIRNKELNYANRIYNIAYLIIVVKAFYAYSDIIEPIRTQMVLNICNVLLLAILAYKMVFMQKYNIKQVFICLILAVITRYTDMKTYMFMMLPDFFLIAATQEVDFKKTIKLAYRLEAVIIGIHVAVYPIMYVFARNLLHFSIRGGETGHRHQFLLSHANIFSMLLLWTILGYIYVNYEKLTKRHIISCWLIYFFFYLFTDSNSGLIILSAITIILLLKNIIGDGVDKVVTFLARYLYFILFLIFDFLMLIFPLTSGKAREIWLSVDDFFTGRLKYGSYAYYQSGFTLFGQHIDFPAKIFWENMWFDAGACDNAYMWISVSYGLVYIFIIGFLFWKYGKKATFEEKLIFIAYSLYTMMELYVTYMYFCFGVILVGKYLWENNKQEDFLGKKLKNARKQESGMD